jgi:23S rRNA pseudouridine1911/1915/1917 synthase
MKRRLHLPTDAAGQRLDVVLAAITGLSRSQLQKRLREGLVAVDGVVVNSKYTPRGGEMVALLELPATATPVVPKLPILYEDDDVLVIDKPAGLLVHASESGKLQPTVAAFARAHGVRDNDAARPGIVHRLDRDTSGVMVLAKTLAAKADLQRQFKNRRVGKTYIALVRGHLSQAEAIINLPIGRDRTRPLRRAVVPGGRLATTQYRVVAEYPGATLVEIDLHTGRTHQIRVHFSHIGHPILGDALYGDTVPTPGLPRQFLHASQLALQLPSGRPMSFRSPLPLDLQIYLDSLNNTV